MPAVRDLVTLDGASALIGDVLAVDDLAGMITVSWQPVITSELSEDLTIVRDLHIK
jgi:hypothetical protein